MLTISGFDFVSPQLWDQISDRRLLPYSYVHTFVFLAIDYAPILAARVITIHTFGLLGFSNCRLSFPLGSILSHLFSVPSYLSALCDHLNPDDATSELLCLPATQTRHSTAVNPRRSYSCNGRRYEYPL